MKVLKDGLLKCKKGEIIFAQGEASVDMYDVRWGTVGIYVNYGTKEEKLLAKLGSGECFGEMGMVEGCLRSATAVALEGGTQLERITAETFDAYFKERPAKVFSIMQNLSQRIRGLTRDYLEACQTLSVMEKADGAQTDEMLQAKVEKFVGDYRGSAQND